MTGGLRPAILLALALVLGAFWQPLAVLAGQDATAKPRYAFHLYEPPASDDNAPLDDPVPEERDPGGSPKEGTYKDGIYIVDPDYLYSYGESVWQIFTGPLRYERDDWITAALVAGTTGALLLVDEVVQEFWQDNARNSTTDSLSDGFRLFGDTKGILFGSLGAYAVSEALGLKREKAAALMVLESFALSAVLVDGIKYVGGRVRPNKTDDRFDFEGPAKDDFNASFVSGHAANAFAVASVLSEVYGDDYPWVSWLSYTAASGAALSRVNDNKHWASDVFLGSAIGYFIGKTVTRLNPFLEKQGLEITPFAEEGGQGIALSYRF